MCTNQNSKVRQIHYEGHESMNAVGTWYILFRTGLYQCESSQRSISLWGGKLNRFLHWADSLRFLKGYSIGLWICLEAKPNLLKIRIMKVLPARYSILLNRLPIYYFHLLIYLRVLLAFLLVREFALTHHPLLTDRARLFCKLWWQLCLHLEQYLLSTLFHEKTISYQCINVYLINKFDRMACIILVLHHIFSIFLVELHWIGGIISRLILARISIEFMWLFIICRSFQHYTFRYVSSPPTIHSWTGVVRCTMHDFFTLSFRVDKYPFINGLNWVALNKVLTWWARIVLLG